jgi:excisionase family DNA binding protein
VIAVGSARRAEFRGAWDSEDTTAADAFQCARDALTRMDHSLPPPSGAGGRRPPPAGRGESQGQRRLLDIGQLAARLDVTPRFVRRLVAERRIAFIKVGHYVRFDPNDVDAWIDHRRVDPPR